jgi:hypothetical protein
MVTVCGVELAPTAVDGKVRLDTENFIVGAFIAVPYKGRDCGEPTALSVASRFAVKDPATAGLKEMVRVHVAPTASDVLQVVAEKTNELALVPEKL